MVELQVGLVDWFKSCMNKKEYAIKKFMKKLLIILLVIIFALFCVGCNKQLIDLKYSFNYAIVGLPNGEVVEGKVQSWTDFEDGDQIQVKIDGVTYLVHSSNIALMDR